MKLERLIQSARSATTSLRVSLRPALALGLCVCTSFVTPAQSSGVTDSAFLVPRMAAKAPLGAGNICQKYEWACATSKRGSKALTDHQLKVAQRINRAVNRRVTQITDQSQYREEEVWALPTRRGGDCEDFVLLKKRLLMSSGIAPERLLIATALDRRRNSHAVLILRTDEGDYVLDNLNNRMLHWKETGYIFLRLQNSDAPHSWSGVLKFG
ncbi:MAG: transglutaminase-like cysteine peptidase [Paracoccaceae bacterium]